MAAMSLQRKMRIVIISLLLLIMVCIYGCEGESQQAVSDNVHSSEVEEEEEIVEGENNDDGEEYRTLEEAVDDFLAPEEEELQPEDIIDRPKVKGIFVTGPMAGTANMENLITLVDETELNAIVLDVKNDEGRITYDMQIPAVQEIGAGIRYIQDMESLIAKCKEKDIYLIARIVTFKDPFLAEAKPQWCIHNADGSIFRDKDGLAWINPYDHEVWEYLLDIAQEALRMGFDEVQFDYIRFSTDSGMKDVDFGQEAEEKDREEIITEFVKYASERVHEAGGAISADVYGMVIDSRTDQQIVGQNYIEMSRYLDYISPMVYPSHYGPYNYNIPVPDAEPYRLVLTALQSSRKVLAGISEETVSGNMEPEYTAEQIASLSPSEGISVQVRPWLQDFTATWVQGHISYGPEEIRAQIQAVYDAGYEEWILWNAANRYTEEGLLREEDKE
ncbi:MAG: putative glycoside hydrolase [Lachnospiraceae bacterium]|nr:putative glycoside hydrolase [Lachnospiraceae bacterium]